VGGILGAQPVEVFVRMLAKDWIGCSKLNTGRQGLFVGHGCSSQAASFTARPTVVKKAWGPLEHRQGGIDTDMEPRIFAWALRLPLNLMVASYAGSIASVNFADGMIEKAMTDESRLQ
jgi:hypothetical protein